MKIPQSKYPNPDDPNNAAYAFACLDASSWDMGKTPWKAVLNPETKRALQKKFGIKPRKGMGESIWS